MTYTANTDSANSGVFNTNTGEQITLTQTNNNGSVNVNATAKALYQNASTVLISDITQEVTLSSAPSGLTIGETITFSDGTNSVTSTLESFNNGNSTLTVNSISGTITTAMNAITGSTTGTITLTSSTHTGVSVFYAYFTTTHVDP